MRSKILHLALCINQNFAERRIFEWKCLNFLYILTYPKFSFWTDQFNIDFMVFNDQLSTTWFTEGEVKN